MSETKFTTARVLADYRADLIDGGFAPDEAFAMARDAADHIIREDGLCVRELGAERMCGGVA